MNANTLSGRAALFLFCLGLLFSAAASAEIAVIVHPDNHSEMDARDIARIFLGSTRSFPNGTTAEPIDQPEDSLTRAVFVSHVLDMTPRRLKSHWSQLKFSGRGRPPKVVGQDEKIKEAVSKNPSMIGYIDAALVDDTVRVVYSY